MNTCHKYQRWLLTHDATGKDRSDPDKLPLPDPPEWVRVHLGECRNCREEQAFFRVVHEAVKNRDTGLLPEEALTMKNSILQKSLETAQPFFSGFTERMKQFAIRIPVQKAVFAALALFLVFGFAWLGVYTYTPENKMAPNKTIARSPVAEKTMENQFYSGGIQEEEYEIVKNLDLLKELDDIRKLVKTLDPDEFETNRKKDPLQTEQLPFSRGQGCSVV